MRNKLPVYIENRELPNQYKVDNRRNSYGYVSVLYLASIIITLLSVMAIFIFGNR